MKRLNYIGSKFQLLHWLKETILNQTKWTSFKGKTVADLFSGTGVVSLMFSDDGSKVIANDAELYSSTIVRSLLSFSYSSKITQIIEKLNGEIIDPKDLIPGYITIEYSPYQTCKRQFFTVENAKRIDHIRDCIWKMKQEQAITDLEYNFLNASLIVSSDMISNVPAVYGCYLKKFKAKAQASFVLHPIHQFVSEPIKDHKIHRSDILSLAEQIEKVDLVYLDPPYNERNYSANYFPLNMIAKNPEETSRYEPLKGVTGIPIDCFRSDFCKKTKVRQAFEQLFKALEDKTSWIILSYNSESLINRETLLKIIKEQLPSSKTEVITRPYKRFKNFEYNKEEEQSNVEEYLYCINIQSC